MSQSEMEEATRWTLNSLTLGEKQLARELTNSEQYFSDPGQAFYRSPSLNLIESIAIVRAQTLKQYKTNAAFIYLFCDTLTIEDGAIIAPDATDDDLGIQVQIFARKIQSKTPGKAPSLKFNFKDGSTVSIGTANIPSDMRITCTGLDGPDVIITPQVESSKFGVYLKASKDRKNIVVEQQTASIAASTTFNYLDRITEDGQISNKSWLNDDLARLLKFQMLVAQAISESNKKLAIDLLTFVVAATDSKYSIYLNLQANTMLSNLLLEDGVLSVPSVNVYSAKTILKSRLVAATVFEQAFRDFRSEFNNSNVDAMTAFNAVARNKDATDAYEFQRDLKQKEFDNAARANEQASSRLETSRNGLDDLSGKFEAGIDKWQQKEKEKAAISIVKQLLLAAVAVGATVATAGAAAPLGVAAVGNLANGASKIAKVIQMLKSFYDKIKDLLEKLKPVIEKIKELVKTVQTVIKTLNDLKNAVGDAATLRPKDDANDPINATAEYDRFDIEVRELEAGMAGYDDIEGKSEYFRALKMLVVDGKAAISAQANIVQRGNELAIVLVQKQVEERDSKRLLAAAQNISTDGKIAEILMKAMFERVLGIRSIVYLDFYTFVTAYRYHTLSNDRVVALSPLKPVGDYLEDMAALQGAISSYGSRELVQQRVFKTKTLGEYDAQTLASILSSGKEATLNFLPYDDMFRGCDRIRMSRVRCYLDGVTPKTPTVPDEKNAAMPEYTKNITIELRTSSQFFDRSMKDGLYGIRSFVADSRTVLFEYSPDTGAISCDGEYGQERDYAKHSPMNAWSIRLLDEQGGTDVSALLDELDFSKFRGIKMEFLCEFVWRGEESVIVNASSNV